MQLLESMLSKLVEEFENRLNSQNELVCLVSLSISYLLFFFIPHALTNGSMLRLQLVK